MQNPQPKPVPVTPPKLKCLTCLVAGLAMLTGCATSSYYPPGPAYPPYDSMRDNYPSVPAELAFSSQRDWFYAPPNYSAIPVVWDYDPLYRPTALYDSIYLVPVPEMISN